MAIKFIRLRFPYLEKDEEISLQYIFDQLHEYLKNSYITFNILKNSKEIILYITCEEKFAENIKSLFSSIRGLEIQYFDLKSLDSKLAFIKLNLVKSYLPINPKDTYKSIINILSSSDTDIFISFTFIPTHKNLFIDLKLAKYKKDLIKYKNEILLYESKKASKLYLCNIYIGALNINIQKSIFSIFKASEGSNHFVYKNIGNFQKLNIKKENILIYLFRKYFGFYLNSYEISHMLNIENISRGSYSQNEVRILEASNNFLKKDNLNIFIGKSKSDSGESKKIYFPIENFDRHVYLLGRTGSGKSTSIINFYKNLNSIKNDKSLIILDPHGSDILKILQTSKNISKYIYFDLSVSDRIITYNPFFCFGRSDAEKDIRVEQYLSIIIEQADIKGQLIGTSTESLLRKAFQTLVYFPDAYYNFLLRKGVAKNRALNLVRSRQLTFNDIEFIFDKHYSYRETLKEIFMFGLPKSDISLFWLKEINSYNTTPIVLEGLRNRLNNILFPSIKLMFEGNLFDPSKLINEYKNILIPLTIQSFGNVSREIFAKIFLSEIWFNAQFKKDQNTDTYIFIDEFQNVQMKLIDTLLSEGRKYGIRLIFGNQYLGQLNKYIKDSIKGNVSTIFSYNIGNIEEAKEVPMLFRNKITAEQVSSLPIFNAYLRTIDIYKDKDIAFMSYETVNFEKVSKNYQNISDLQSLSDKCLQDYGEEKSELREKLYRKKFDAKKYFINEL